MYTNVETLWCISESSVLYAYFKKCFRGPKSNMGIKNTATEQATKWIREVTVKMLFWEQQHTQGNVTWECSWSIYSWDCPYKKRQNQKPNLPPQDIEKRKRLKLTEA